MIKFFRKIRQKLLTENKFSKYLLYAVGEIILVVIGILIALQINTWNQEKLLKQKETKSLFELKSNLERNVRQLDKFSKGQGRIVNRMEKLITFKELNIIYQDSLSPYFKGISWLEQIDLVFSTYETMKTNGLDLISTDSLRLNIIELHEVRYGHFKDFVTDAGLAYYSSQVLPMHLKYIELSDRYDSKEYHQFLKNRVTLKKNGFVRMADGLKSETEGLIKQIDIELERLFN